MEGVLYKWTNYLAGWQPRWFVLDKGILTYYKSQDEMSQGCKGSVKMACCEIQVHPTDETRLDLIIPGEQHFYVRGATPADRQRWLVALGSAKACLADSKIHQRKEESEDSLRTKMSELRLYCDLLTQQVATVKLAGAGTANGPDLEKLNESSSLLSATCDTFIKTLQDCMKLAKESFTPNIHNMDISNTVLPPSTPYSDKKKSSAVQRSHSVEDRYVPQMVNKHGVTTRYRNLEEMAARTPHSRPSSRTPSISSQEGILGGLSATPGAHGEVRKSSSLPTTPTPASLPTTPTPEKVLVNGSGVPHAAEARVPTFFSTLPTKFSDVQIEPDESIPTQPFLDACTCIVGVFDALSPTAFAPVKMDVNGNIRKLRQKYSTDPEMFMMLQGMVQEEVRSKTTQVKNSATDALMWLRRTLEFIREFLTEIIKGERDMNLAATNAYGRTLKKYHGWVVRGVFALAAKAVPSMEYFLQFLATNKEDADRDDFEGIIIRDLEECVKALTKLTQILQQHYERGALETEEIV
ncbi:pleckstrin homology domain-containing family A member 8-like [Diadema setosum]|uniref:pleckstrin homology domain-containing family A member 8-like n=1 Tax=Diadema setosum TaxID=31175 RepID=UPI003B3B2F90